VGLFKYNSLTALYLKKHLYQVEAGILAPIAPYIRMYI